MYIYIYIYIYIYTVVKNHLSGSPGQVKFQSGQAYVSSYVQRTSKKIQCKVRFPCMPNCVIWHHDN